MDGITLSRRQEEAIDEARFAANGLVRVLKKVIDSDNGRPEWWTAFHDEAITIALEQALETINTVMERGSDQCGGRQYGRDCDSE